MIDTACAFGISVRRDWGTWTTC